MIYWVFIVFTKILLILVELKFFIPNVLSNAYRVKLVSGETSTLLAPVGSTVTRVQTETEVY